MKKVVVALAALALAAPAFAQQQPPQASEHRSVLGVGVSITELSAAIVSPTIEVYLPIQVGPNLRIEPSLGIFTNDRPTGQTDTSNITLGVGVFVQQKVAQPVDLYVGGRLKLNFASTDDGTTSNSGTDFTIAAAIGGEYYFVPKFSIGLEGQLGFYSNSEVSGDNSGFYTTGLGFLRVYF
jgi:Outer membrane protein beta-barrel domain